ncbi:MAG: ABC transporter ATP-binding protein [Planctomycetota bacterium]|nr:ABC transporter ATP-binding protein [Planctomycetota bacterium]
MNGLLLAVRNLRVTLPTPQGACNAVNGVSFDIASGSTTGIVGESGSGKSMTCLSILGLQPASATVAADSITFEGRQLIGLSESAMRPLRGREIAIVFQNPMSSLNPYLSIERQLTEGMQVHLKRTRAQARGAAIELLQRVAIPEPERRLWWYPHEFSGGMLQRIAIAMALACEPRLLVADEPTTALDATVQAEILQLLKNLQSGAKEGADTSTPGSTGSPATSPSALGRLAMLFVSHDLDVVARVCDNVLVMYAGRIVEEGPSRDLLSTPLHPYTRALLECVPRLGAPCLKRTDRLPSIPGAPPDPTSLPRGCAFHPRCPVASAECRDKAPELLEVKPGRRVACFGTAGSRG